MKQQIYQIDAFTDKLFCGNPAAVCILSEWLSDEIMQKIAGENNLSETAFAVLNGDHFDIRWFTPTLEVDLCGHATLAAAHVLFEHEGYTENIIHFKSRSGILKVRKESGYLILNFPTDTLQKISLPHGLKESMNIQPSEAYKGISDILLVYKDQSEIEKLRPDFDRMLTVAVRGVIVTAKGNEADFVSRFFAPNSGVNEDPVTGSAHTTLIPYWSEKLSKKEMTAIQLSKRKGYLNCKYLGERVEIAGKAITYLKGMISIK